MLLYTLVFAPFLAALLMVAASGKDYRAASRLAIILSSLLFIASLGLLASGDAATNPVEWFTIPGANATVSFAFSSHGFGAWMVFLSNIITLAALVASRKTMGGNYRNFAVGLFALLGALDGTFLSADAVLFFFFFEAMVFPAAVLIGAYGGTERHSAALNFAIYTLAGSAPMAVALWYMISAAGSSNPFALLLAVQTLPEHTQTILFWCFAIAFWVKTPLFPFHGWQAQTYAEAPAPLSAVLTGAMSKAGVFGFLYWVIPIFPMDRVANVMMWLGLVTALYGALMAIRATDAKKLLAFSSMGHLGLAVAGLFTLSSSTLAAVLMLLVAHGLSSSALYILAGSAERFAGSRRLEKMGGFASRYPVFGFFFGFAGIAAVAIPGTAGFVGEFLVLFSLWNVGVWPAIVAVICIILTAVYMLRFIQAVLFGVPHEDLSKETEKLRFPISDALAVAPLLLLLILFGLHPSPVTDSVSVPSVENEPATADVMDEDIDTTAVDEAALDSLSADSANADTATLASDSAAKAVATSKEEIQNVR
ncbi:MAG: NADH-quinone oxidoreductase subunit M [Fibrobacteraceae bacterium]|nr:NADH-quinone oxidoreductase subunit M [Fibrobacteraceae bacterium]